MFQCIIQQRNGWIHAPNPEFRDVFPDIRLQLNEQLRCLDVRVESQVSLIQELQDFFRRRGEVELDYSKSLDKLAKSLQLRHKEQKQKREQWPLFSSYTCWQQLVNQTKSLSKDHAALSEIYSTHLVARLQTVCEDVQRIYRRCREIGYETHEEILRVLQELHTTMKTYHTYQAECKEAEKKLRTAETQRTKLQQTVPKEKLDRSKKYRLIQKEELKRLNKYTDARLKALKAKNEYQLCLEASNTTIHKYFVEDLSDLIDCMDLGFHSVVSRALLLHVSADQGRCRAVLSNAETLSHIVHAMDSRADKQKFLEQHHGAFMIPKRLEFQGQQDEVEPELQKALHQEMESRLTHLETRVNNLRMESEEIWKTLEAAEVNLLEILNTKDYDCSSLFGDTQFNKLDAITSKQRADKQEIEEFYITKIREYILCTSRIARLDSKAEFLRNILAKESALNSSITSSKALAPKRKRIGRMNMSGRPKLFGGSLEEYLEATQEDIPLIMRSCIKIINLYGLHHQGIFRVSGSQVEISNFREWFERGDDPLADTTDASDINSVAGVLKLFLRELREPIFPIIYFDHLLSIAQLDTKQEIIQGIRKFISNLPRSVIIVVRYLFDFLNHLSEYSDENMMDAYNLAICFGPTLMPAPEDKDQVQYQNQVNELIKNIIIYHEDVFPRDIGGIFYEKYITNEPFDEIDVGDSPTDQVTEDPDSEVYPSEDESDTFEATVQFDFNARSERELSLRKGEAITLYNQVSNDWWRGQVNGKTGLIPDKYISLKIKDEDREKSSDHMKSSSSEESVRKRRPSGNISLNSQLSICTQNSNTLSNITYGSDYTASTVSASIPAPVLPKSISQASTPHHVQSIDVSSSDKNGLKETDFPQYENTETLKKHSGYVYHDEPHSFENTIEFMEDSNHFTYESSAEKRSPNRPEPIYAEPTKISLSNKENCDTSEDESVVLRPKPKEDTGPKLSLLRNSDGIDCDMPDSSEKRFSDSDINKNGDVPSETLENRPSFRRYHSKSLSLSENRVALGASIFQQHRDLWQQRAAGKSQQNIGPQRILSRNRIAPDLVMDLPNDLADAQIRASRESLDGEAENLTSAERFATQNQCTLKKNERFLSEADIGKKEVKLECKIIAEKPKAEVRPQQENLSRVPTVEIQCGDGDENDELLHINEPGSSGGLEEKQNMSRSLRDVSKSPIPLHNTQKFASQFAGLHLTGGCMGKADTAAQGNLTSFKPQVKVKPQIMKKPLVLPPTTPEMNRRASSQE
ncbi:SLIT-ROBO Rho GTPase-activating protein 1-like isoform X2 [Culicoides brevitarsis]|uniref:SLIT-ROBO Rho GTPase-activating protein 1-like isoform X2 n=1 Tax=Culicoides brevitarsis TaxID=469753 RepID=UPI00307BA582